jgi:hypothetical protein
MQEIPQSKTTPFHKTTEKEVGVKDKEFIGEDYEIGLEK